jgi:hypothetical protein
LWRTLKEIIKKLINERVSFARNLNQSFIPQAISLYSGFSVPRPKFRQLAGGKNAFYQAGGTSNWNNIYPSKTAEEKQGADRKGNKEEEGKVKSESEMYSTQE